MLTLKLFVYAIVIFFVSLSSSDSNLMIQDVILDMSDNYRIISLKKTVLFLLVLGANPSLTAATVVLTGLVGANFVQFVLDKLRLNDPIARGIATASSAHGLGTAALSAKEPEALPFCAIAYGLTGIFGSLLCSVPIVRQSLVLIIG